MTPLEEEVVELRALVRRMASAASSYNSRIYQVGFEPEIAQYLTDEEIGLNSERPSAADDRARYDAERLREQLEAVRARLEEANGPVVPSFASKSQTARIAFRQGWRAHAAAVYEPGKEGN